MFLLDIGYYRLEHKIYVYFDFSNETRKIFFWSMVFLKDLLIQVIIGTVFIYWFSLKLKRNLCINLVFLLFGALAADYLIYVFSTYKDLGTFFSYSPFFDNMMATYLYNIVLWSIIFYLSIMIASIIKFQQIKTNKNKYITN